MSSFSYASNITTGSNSINVSNGLLIFCIDVNYQKPITSKDTRLTIAITDIIISDVLYFNISQKPRFNKVLDSERNIYNTYITSNINIVSKKLLDVIHEYNMKINLGMI